MKTRLKTQLNSELKLSRVKGCCCLSKCRQRVNARTEGVVRNAQVGTIQHVETFGDEHQICFFSYQYLLAQTQIQRCVVETATSIPAETRGPIIVIRVEVTIVSHEHVKR